MISQAISEEITQKTCLLSPLWSTEFDHVTCLILPKTDIHLNRCTDSRFGADSPEKTDLLLFRQWMPLLVGVSRLQVKPTHRRLTRKSSRYDNDEVSQMK